MYAFPSICTALITTALRFAAARHVWIKFELRKFPGFLLFLEWNSDIFIDLLDLKVSNYKMNTYKINSICKPLAGLSIFFCSGFKGAWETVVHRDITQSLSSSSLGKLEEPQDSPD
jgi:hypothetical protein